MNKIEQFEDLEVWQEASKIATVIYKISEEGKLKTDWGMRDQIRRSATSISNNIAEGFEYNSNKSFIRYLRIAKGSAGELRSQLFILKEAGFITLETYTDLYSKCIGISKQIAGFMKYLKKFELNRLKATIVNLPILKFFNI